MQQESYISQNPEETATIAQNVASLLHPGDVLCLKGDLGSGKSTFVRALIQSLCGSTTDVPSPTFTLVQTYETPRFIAWHFDLYRLEESEEIYELGIEEALQRGVSLIEWPEKAESLLPKDCREIEFEYGTSETERILTFKGWVAGTLKI
jgi:tRNA threonylcarbamoyl adenosine modification protein YjeE